MIWYGIRYTIFGVFVALTIYFVWKRKYENLLWLYFFTFPFQNCAAYVITTWNPYKVVAIGMACVMLFQPIKQKQPPELKQLFSCFVFLLLISNIVGMLSSSTAGLRSVVRLCVQDITYVLGFIPILYIKWLPWDFGKRVLKWYTAAICVLIGIGFIHYVFLKTGIPFAPIMRDVGISNPIAAAQFGESIVYRVYGLCGEPKNMAFALTPFVLYIIAKMLIDKDYRKCTWFILFSSIFMLINTYSSAAYIEFTIGIAGVAFIALDTANQKAKYLFASVLLLCFVLIYSYTLVAPETPNNITHTKEDSSFFKNFYDRSFGRAQNEMEEGRTETIIIQDFLQSNNAIYYLFGYGPGQYSFHSEKLTLAEGYIPVQSGLVLNLVDFGLCGYLYFFFLLHFVLKLYARSQGGSDRTPLYFIIMGGAVLLGNMMYSMMGGSILIGMIPFIGIAYWIDYNNRNIENSYD